MKLPLLVSVPHAGLLIPPELRDICLLTEQQVAEDGDGGAREIYALENQVEAFVTTEVARVSVDLNRGPEDFGPDGVIKTNTCYGLQVYSVPPDSALRTGLLKKYYFPYHRRLQTLGSKGNLLAGIDCHTMAVTGPPIGPDPGEKRPAACLGNADGTCPVEWIESLAGYLGETLGKEISINKPFRGGYITRRHAKEMPWLQIELARSPVPTQGEKKEMLLVALEKWCLDIQNKL